MRVGGDFVASTLNIPNDTFLSGNSQLFSGTSKAAVVNLGQIYSEGGSVFLVGRAIRNGGSIRAPQGSAGLAAGSAILIKDSTGDQRVFVQGPGGDVTNTGTIAAAQAELKAKPVKKKSRAGVEWLANPVD